MFEDEPGQMIGNAGVYAAFSTIIMSGCDRIHGEVVAEIAQEEGTREAEVTWEMIAPRITDATKSKLMKNNQDWPDGSQPKRARTGQITIWSTWI